MNSISPPRPYFPMSPVLYSLSPPASLYGSGTNFSAVSPASFQYPRASPSPPMYISPGTPSPIASISLPRMCTLVFPIGFPIGIVCLPLSSLLTSWLHVNVVPSVGPYPFISRHPSTSSTTLIDCSTGSTSPPATNCLTPLRPSMFISTICPNSADVSHILLTPLLFISSPNSSTVCLPALAIATFPPFNSPPQFSNVAASNDIGAYCRITSPSSNFTYSVFFTSLTTPRCVTATPFGFPVDPDVYITYARLSPLPSTSRFSPLSFSISPLSSSTFTTSTPSSSNSAPTSLLLNTNPISPSSIICFNRSTG